MCWHSVVAWPARSLRLHALQFWCSLAIVTGAAVVIAIATPKRTLLVSICLFLLCRQEVVLHMNTIVPLTRLWAPDTFSETAVWDVNFTWLLCHQCNRLHPTLQEGEQMAC